jgi:hypothetical protein
MSVADVPPDRERDVLPIPQNVPVAGTAVPDAGIPEQVAAATFNNAAPDVVLPEQLVTTQRYAYPSHEAGTLFSERVDDVPLETNVKPA